MKRRAKLPSIPKFPGTQYTPLLAYLHPYQRRQLDAQCARTGQSRAAVLREALDLFLRKTVPK